MTVRALGGLLVLNLFVLGVGAGVLWGVRGWRWWTDFVRLAGVAYFLGLSALTILTMYELVLGIPVNPVTGLLTGAGLVAAGILVGRRRGFVMPGLRPPGWRFPGISLFAALFVAGIVVYFEALFRAERLAGAARVWDSWANWLPKSKALYASGRLDLEFLALVPQLPSYPPGPASLQAGAFHAMGSADAVTLHVQYWFVAALFLAAVVGLLARRVRPAILFPVLLAFLVAPYLLDWLTTVYADLPMGYFVALAALLLILWLEERKRWQLTAATVLFAGAMLTKREGMVFVACVLVAALVASLADRRRSWRALLAAGLVAGALVVPWTIWTAVHDLSAAGKDTGFVLFSSLDRVWPSVEVSVRSAFHAGLWHFAPLLAVAAIVLALLAGAWRLSLFAGTFLVVGVAAVTWLVWSNLGLSPVHSDWAIRRFTGTVFLVLAVLTPLLLQRAWSSEPPSGAVGAVPGPDVLFRSSWAAWAVVLVGVLSHPGSALVGYSGSGLPGGWPSFPGTAGCDVPPVDGANVRLVVGYADSYPEAVALRDRARGVGLTGVEASQDGCGHLRVYVDDLPTMAAAEGLLVEAQAAGLSPTLELDPDD